MTDNPNPFIQEEEKEILIDSKKGFFGIICNFLNNLFSSDKKIGALNGKWATMLKICLMVAFISGPPILTWCTLVTKNVFDSSMHFKNKEHFDKKLAEFESNVKIIERIEIQLNKISDKVETLPPPEWRRRIEILEAEYTKANVEIRSLDKINSIEHGQILILLESIKTKLDMLAK